jgi:hypothetical protein
VSLRTRVLPVFDRLRALAGPTHFDLRTTSVAIVSRTWAGGFKDADPPLPGGAASSDTVLSLLPIYEVRQLTTREVSGSGGRYEFGDVKVGPVTPSFVARDGTPGGVTESDLKPDVTTDAVEIIYRLVGAHGGEYALVSLDSTKPFGYEIVLRRRATTP